MGHISCFLKRALFSGAPGSSLWIIHEIDADNGAAALWGRLALEK